MERMGVCLSSAARARGHPGTNGLMLQAAGLRSGTAMEHIGALDGTWQVSMLASH